MFLESNIVLIVPCSMVSQDVLHHYICVMCEHVAEEDLKKNSASCTTLATRKNVNEEFLQLNLLQEIAHGNDAVSVTISSKNKESNVISSSSSSSTSSSSSSSSSSLSVSLSPSLQHKGIVLHSNVAQVHVPQQHGIYFLSFDSVEKVVENAISVCFTQGCSHFRVQGVKKQLATCWCHSKGPSKKKYIHLAKKCGRLVVSQAYHDFEN